MPVDEDIKKVLIIGSGPIQIGQAAEFDYSGSQACKSLREEGLETVLVNSNPATIQTDMDMADTVYTEPLTPELVAQIIEKEELSDDLELVAVIAAAIAASEGAASTDGFVVRSIKRRRQTARIPQDDGNRIRNLIIKEDKEDEKNTNYY